MSKTKTQGSLDTNVILRALLDDVPQQHQAATALLNDPLSLFEVADTALVETVFALERYYNMSRVQITEAIQGFAFLPQINCNQPLLEKALLLFGRYPQLSFEDCCLASYAQINNAEPLWTFDQKLAKQVASAQLVKVS